MRWYLRRGARGVVHRAVKEAGQVSGGSKRWEYMMTACGLSITWSEPHAPWERAPHKPEHGDYRANITCRRCAG